MADDSNPRYYSPWYYGENTLSQDLDLSNPTSYVASAHSNASLSSQSSAGRGSVQDPCLHLRDSTPSILTGNPYIEQTMSTGYTFAIQHPNLGYTGKPPAKLVEMYNKFTPVELRKGAIPGELQRQLLDRDGYARWSNPPERFPNDAFDMAGRYGTQYTNKLVDLAIKTYEDAAECAVGFDRSFTWRGLVKSVLRGTSDLQVILSGIAAPSTIVESVSNLYIRPEILPMPCPLPPQLDYLISIKLPASSSAALDYKPVGLFVESTPSFCPVVITQPQARGQNSPSQYNTATASTAILRMLRTHANRSNNLDRALPTDVFKKLVPIPSLEVVEHNWLIYWTFWDSATTSTVVQMGPYFVANTGTLLGVFTLLNMLVKLQEWGVRGYWGMLQQFL